MAPPEHLNTWAHILGLLFYRLCGLPHAALLGSFLRKLPNDVFFVLCCLEVGVASGQYCLLCLPSNPISAGILKYHPTAQSMFSHAAQNKSFISPRQLADDQADLLSAWTLVKTNEIQHSLRGHSLVSLKLTLVSFSWPSSLLTLGLYRLTPAGALEMMMPSGLIRSTLPFPPFHCHIDSLRKLSSFILSQRLTSF